MKSPRKYLGDALIIGGGVAALAGLEQLFGLPITLVVGGIVVATYGAMLDYRCR